MRLVILGSPAFPDLDAVQAFVAALPPDVVLLAGGAPGVKERALQTAYARGLATAPPAPGRARFRYPAPGQVIALWDGRDDGTARAIRAARAAGVPTLVVTPVRAAG